MMQPDDTVIRASGLGKRFDLYATPRDRLKQLVLPRMAAGAKSLGLYPRPIPRYRRELWALRNISFDLKAGESLGVIGRNGGGKSTLLQIIAGTLTPTEGDIEVKGKVAALLELGSGFNPEFTGRENVLLSGRILGLSGDEIEARFKEIEEFADIGDFIDQPVKTYSSGMFVRLAFAVHAHIDASIMIIDEALAVGDVFFRQKCYARLERLREAGTVIILVSHAMTDIEQFCDKAIFLEKGEVKFIGDAAEAAKLYYLHHQEEPHESEGFDVSAQPMPLVSPKLTNWPPNEVFTNASEATQVTNGWATCLRYGVCAADGSARTSFLPGDDAIFCSEFRLERSIPIPLAGVVIQSERGVNVHGKGALEHNPPIAPDLPAGTVIRFRQTVRLQLAPGRYTFELGLAALDVQTYENISALNHERIFSRVVRVCQIPNAGTFTIEPLASGHPPHAGIADLPGSFSFEFRETAEELPINGY